MSRIEQNGSMPCRSASQGSWSRGAPSAGDRARRDFSRRRAVRAATEPRPPDECPGRWLSQDGPSMLATHRRLGHRRGMARRDAPHYCARDGGRPYRFAIAANCAVGEASRPRAPTCSCSAAGWSRKAGRRYTKDAMTRGLARVIQGMDMCRGSGAVHEFPHYWAALADAYRVTGRIDGACRLSAMGWRRLEKPRPVQ